ncbi:MAG: hypothetical protein N0E44_21625 [Candidatus Thiodiazotropha lotti]|nr:hypothetical protein [Candidatus Thiodiazotropha lotti]MCW4222474.1 hypothetical protein [Candidatus Thiodiazotropha lotti]
MNLNNWISKAKEHWKEFQPTRYQELKESGQLEQALQQAAEQTHLEMSELEEAGYQNHEAWEMVRERYLFPKEELGLEEDQTVSQAAMLYQEVVAIQNLLLQDQDQEE